MQPAGEPGAMAAQAAGRRFSFLASPTVWLMVLSVLAGVSLAAMVPLSLLSHQVGNGVVALVIGAPCAGVGLVVARRQPANPLGWLFLVIAICLFVSSVGGAYAALAAAALFSLLRRRVQRIVDRRFNRAGYDAELMVAAFALRLKDAVELESVGDDLADVVQQALEPAHVWVWMSERG
jgi:hypothetical protein